jgi:hypothetical protein
MDREKDIQHLHPAPFRDRLELELRKLGATSEKRAISIATVGQWPFRCTAKLTATLLSDPRFIVSNLGHMEACVHVPSQPSPKLSDATLRNITVADVSSDEDSSSESAEEHAKRPLKASDKRRKIRRVISPENAAFLPISAAVLRRMIYCHNSLPLSDTR